MKNIVYTNAIGKSKPTSKEAKRMLKNVKTMTLEEMKKRNEKAYEEREAHKAYLKEKKNSKK